MRLFPLFADLRGRQVLVVGGGVVATRKVEALLEAGAHVTVGAPRHAPELLALAAAGRICVRSGDFAPDWLDGAWLVVAATDERDINSAVAAAAGARRMLANVVDDPELSTFQVPAVVDRAPLVIAVSSAGAAPVLARRVRERMESLFDQSLGELASLAQRHRQAIRAARPDMPARRAFYDWLYDGEVAALLRAGRREQAEQALLAAIEQAEVPRRGRLILLGAGPGPAGQLTLQALRALNEADIIVHAPDVSQEVMGQARRDAHRRQSTAAAAPDAALLRDLGMETAGGSTVVLAAAGAGPALDAAARQWLDDEQVLTIEIRGLAG